MEQLSEIKQVLQQLKPELSRRFHVQSLGLFGSVVRDDFSPSSDIDIIVDFDRPVGIEFIDLAQYIEQRLRKKVDLVSRRGVKDKYFKAIEREIVYV
jgi:predicted nucleotidyltransferase